MTSPSVHRATTLTILCAGILTGLPAFGRIPPPSPPDTGVIGHNAPDGPREELNRIVESLSRRHKTVVLLDPAIQPAFRPKAPPAGLSHEKALDSLANALPRVGWRRVYPPRSLNDPDHQPAALANAVRVLEQWDAGSLTIVNTAAKQAKTLMIERPTPTSFESRLETYQFSDKPLHVLYSIDAGDTHSPADQFTHLQRRQMAMEVRSEYHALGMVQMMQMIQSMEPAARDQLLNRTHEAAALLWESTPLNQRREMMQESLQLMKSFDAGLQARAGNAAVVLPQPADGHERARAPLNHLRQLQTIVHDLSTRADVPIIVDSALLVTDLPEAPDNALGVEQALDALIASIPDAVWRRVHLPELPAKRTPAPERLAAAVRRLDQWERGSLAVLDLKSRRVTSLLQSHLMSPAFKAVLEAGPFSREPVYVLFSASADAAGRTLEERFAGLQRQQTRLMTHLSADQMVQSMQQVTRQFASSDPDTRSRLMALPIMAGMMAVWFPREAKENGPLAPELARP